MLKFSLSSFLGRHQSSIENFQPCIPFHWMADKNRHISKQSYLAMGFLSRNFIIHVHRTVIASDCLVELLMRWHPTDIMIHTVFFTVIAGMTATRLDTRKLHQIVSSKPQRSTIIFYIVHLYFFFLCEGTVYLFRAGYQTNAASSNNNF